MTTANPLRGEVLLKDFGGRDRVIRMNGSVARALEEDFGPLHQFFEKGMFSITRLHRGLTLSLTAGSEKGNPDFEKDSEALLDEWMVGTSVRALEAMTQALKLFLGEDDADPTEPKDKAPPADNDDGAGSSSAPTA